MNTPPLLYKLIGHVTIWALFFAICCQSFASPLEDYLAKPPEIENPAWGNMSPPHETITVCIKLFSDAKTDRDKGLAIGGLAFVSRLMVQHPETREVANDLMARWIVPNIEFTRHVEKTETGSWKNTMIRVIESYKILGNAEGEKAALAMLHDGGEDEDTKEMAVYLLAYQQANAGDYISAIRTIQNLPETSKWTNDRPKMISNWTKRKAQADRESAKEKPKQ